MNKGNEIHVYNFFTGFCDYTMKFGGHVNNVRCIDWNANDMGFATAATDGNVYFYDLY